MPKRLHIFLIQANSSNPLIFVAPNRQVYVELKLWRHVLLSFYLGNK